MRDAGIARATAPARICLAGETLDWMIGGPSIVAAIDLRTAVSVTVNRHNQYVNLAAAAPVDVRRTVRVGQLDRLANDSLDYLQACAAQVLTEGTGGDLLSRTAAAVGAGVSSSAAATVAASAALLTAAEGVVPDVQRVAALAYSAESITASGAGWMDVLACAYGGVRRIEASTPPTTNLLTPTLRTAVVLIDTKQRRTATRVLVTNPERRANAEPRMIAYCDHAPQLVEEIARALTGSRIDYAELGALIDRGQELLSRYLGCSTPLIDRCITACRTAGAYGAKLTGSGHGGRLFALVAPDRIDAVISAVAGLPVRHLVLPDSDSQGVRSILLG